MKREGNKMKENQVKKLVMAAMCVASVSYTHLDVYKRQH